MIDILIPVLGRPHRAAPLVENIQGVTSAPHRITFLCTEEDWDQILAASDGLGAWVAILSAGHGEYPRKINEGARYTDAASSAHFPFVFNASDDIEFQRGWDMAALHQMTEGIHVVATNDKANSQVKKGEFGTHCLIRRSYIDDPGASMDGPGTVFSEAYDHNFVDRELCALAQARGCYAFARDSIVRHLHPLHNSSVQMDATHRKGLATFHQDQERFFRRAKGWNYVGLNLQERRMARNQWAKTHS